MADAISEKGKEGKCQKEVVPHPPILMHGGGGEGAGGGTVHLLNRQPAHLATGNLKQILGSPSQFFFCKSYP